MEQLVQDQTQLAGTFDALIALQIDDVGGARQTPNRRGITTDNADGGKWKC